MVGGADDALLFHSFYEPGRPIVPDLQLALDEGGGAFGFVQYDFHGLAVEIGVGTPIVTPGQQVCGGIIFARYLLYIGGLALTTQMLGHMLYFSI